jgi:hypothetical protein
MADFMEQYRRLRLGTSTCVPVAGTSPEPGNIFEKSSSQIDGCGRTLTYAFA